WAKEQGLADGEPLFFSRQRARGGGLQAISRQRAWEIVRAAAGRADVRVLALRTSRYGKGTSRYGKAGEPAPVHPHQFRQSMHPNGTGKGPGRPRARGRAASKETGSSTLCSHCPCSILSSSDTCPSRGT